MPLMIAVSPKCFRKSSTARSASALRRSSRSRRRGSRAQRADADADQAERGAVGFSRQQFARATAKIFAASWVGASSERARVRRRKSAVLSFSVTVGRRDPLLFRRAATPSRTAARGRARACAKSAMSAFEGGLGRDALGARGRARRRASSMPRASRHSRRPSRRSGASARFRRRAAGRRWCGSRRCGSRSCVAGPTPQMKPTGLSARKARGLVLADHREAARLVEVGGDLGEELVAATARPRR